MEYWVTTLLSFRTQEPMWTFSPFKTYDSNTRPSHPVPSLRYLSDKNRSKLAERTYLREKYQRHKVIPLKISKYLPFEYLNGKSDQYDKVISYTDVTIYTVVRSSIFREYLYTTLSNEHSRRQLKVCVTFWSKRWKENKDVGMYLSTMRVKTWSTLLQMTYWETYYHGYKDTTEKVERRNHETLLTLKFLGK